MAPVSRRSFLAGLIAAPVIVALMPATVESAKLYRIGDHTLQIEPGKWDAADSYRVALWDGSTFIRIVQPRYLGRELVIPVESPYGHITESRFRVNGSRDAQLDALNASYVSGPKWWTAGPR